MKKILLVGSSGQVGQELQVILPELGTVKSFSRQDLDLSQPQTIVDKVAAVAPDVIVNAAAYTAVDRAETEPELAHTINGEAPTALAQAAQHLGATLVHISTDYVFDGRKNTPYLETDSPNPIGTYGKSKLVGEQGIQSHCQKYLILRTAWVYGSRGHGNFVKTMLRLGAEREQLRVVMDQIGSPTWSQNIARAIAALIQTVEADRSDSLWGIYHFTNSGIASWYDFAINIFTEAQTIGFPLKVRQVLPITTAEFPTPAQRPAFSVLSQQKITKTLNRSAPYWRQSLQQMLKELKAHSS